MAKRKTLTQQYEALPKLFKLILQLVLGVVVGGIYRVIRFTETNNLVTLVVGLLCLFTGIGNVIIWVVDLITEFLFDRITVFAD